MSPKTGADDDERGKYKLFNEKIFVYFTKAKFLRQFSQICNFSAVILLVLVSRKIFIGYEAMKYVEKCSDQVSFDTMISSSKFRSKIDKLSSVQPTFILILNKHALNMTLNWLCNTKNMAGVHELSLIVTLDEESDKILTQTWPNLNRLNWIVPCLKDSFNYGDGKYQLFYLLRANLARVILALQKPFWMVQQDTFWRRSLLELNITESAENAQADIIFDRADPQNGHLIAGGYFLVRVTSGAQAYFDKLASSIQSWYVPDNTYMISLCAEANFSCGYIPFRALTNWNWLYKHKDFALSNVSKEPPMLIQFDGYTKLGGKLAKMRSLGFYFLKDARGRCDDKAVEEAIERVGESNKSSNIELKYRNGANDSKGLKNTKIVQFKRSYSQWQFSLYQSIINQLYTTEITKEFLNKVIFPYAHYFMISV